jgi:diguanylate cyclase (GGDEF)-like protein
VVCSARPLDGISSISSRDGFQLAIRTKDFVVDGYEDGTLTSTPALLLFKPMRNAQGALSGVASAALQTSRLDAIAARLAMQENKLVTVLDRHGVVVVCSPTRSDVQGKLYPAALLLARVHETPSGILEAPGVDGQQLHAFIRVGAEDPTALYVVASVPAIDYGPINARLTRNLAIIVLATVCFAFLAWYGVEVYIARNMRLIDATARGLQDGVLTSRTQLDGRRDEMRVVGHAIDEMAAALEHREAGLQSVMHQLSERAVRDALTGLFNSQYMMECLDRELMHARRTRRPVSVLMFDVDHFKAINDTFGHLAGDVVLRELGRLFKGCARQEDVACRYGGEEFVLVMPETDAKTAVRRAEHVCALVRELRYSGEADDVGQVTLSAGVACYPPWNDAPGGLLRAADAALYEAKRDGRDRVVLKESSTDPAKPSQPGPP